MHAHRRAGWLLLLIAGFAWAASAADEVQSPPAAGAPSIVLMLEISDAIGPATSDFFVRTLEHGIERKVRLILVEMDTPGGLDSAMRDMIKAILASPVPVAIYVSPSGARAASAGTYLLYASHIAAMAPATNLGAATPVQIGAPRCRRRRSDDKAPDDKASEKKAPEPATAMERKAVNDAIAYIRGLAELRDRNAEWAESAVRTAASLSASAALEQKVIDVVAVDVPDLLRQIDGRMVKISAGELQIATCRSADRARRSRLAHEAAVRC